MFPDTSVDAVCTNALDHVFDLDRVIAEVRRVLRPGGCFVAEIDEGTDEGSVPGAFEAMQWKQARDVIDRIAKTGQLEVEERRSLGHTRRGLRSIVVLRKPR